MDKISAEKRSWTMSRVRGRDTKPERMLRSLLHRLGYRFVTCRRDLPGRPDVVLPKYNSVVFVNGCFWHRHRRCPRTTMPQANRAYWKAKFERNRARDRDNIAAMETLGWRVFVVWECELDTQPVQTVTRLSRGLRRSIHETGLRAESRRPRERKQKVQ